MGEEKLHDGMARVAELALGWRAKAERYETALMLIGALKGKTLLSIEHGQPYSIGANAAFEECASFANAALEQDPPQAHSPQDDTLKGIDP